MQLEVDKMATGELVAGENCGLMNWPYRITKS